MISTLTAHEHELLQSNLLPRVDEILHDAGELEGAEQIERLACELLMPFQSPAAPPVLATALVELVAGSRAPVAPDLLAALAVLARGEAGRVAAEAGEARGDAGRSCFEGEIGRLEPRAAARVRDGAAEVLQVRFERPGTGAHQLGALFLELDDTGGAALGGMVTGPTAEPQPFLGSGGGRPQPLSVDKLRDRVEQALTRTAELGLAVERELGVCLPLIARGLTGSGDGLPAVDVDLGDGELDEPEPEACERGPLYVDPLDEDAFALIERALLSELDEYVEDHRDPACDDHAGFFAASLLHWKWGYGDGRLATWTEADLADYLLGHVPRKLPSDAETIAAAPRCLALLLRFLDARGSLAGDPLEDLLAAVKRLAPRMAAAARDPSNWGLAKSLVSQMAADGVEPGDQSALDAWMEAFNSRPPEDRDRIVGPALERMAGTGARPAERAPTRAAGPSKAQRRGKRKQVRAARRRNR